MQNKKLLLWVICFFMFFLNKMVHSVHCEYVFNQIYMELSKNINASKIQENICARTGVCGALSEKNCRNQMLVSTCYLLCKDMQKGFRQSHCWQTSIKIDAKTQEDVLVQVEEKPFIYLLNNIENPKKNSTDFYIHCKILCHTFQESQAAQQLLFELLKFDGSKLVKACKQGCLTD